jgi:FK506-binding protein 4/5
VHAAQGLEVTLLNNMAACALKLNDYPEAIGRASRALTIEPRNAKALFRRALAYATMVRHSQWRSHPRLPS